METFKKILGAGFIVVLIIFVGIPFLKGFWQGLTGEGDFSSGVSASQSSNNSSAESSSNYYSSLQTGIVAEKLKRFTDYASEYGIELIYNKERDNMIGAMEQYYSEAVNDIKQYGYFKNGFTVEIVHKLLSTSYYEVRKGNDYYSYPIAYYGELNSNNQPDGYGAIFRRFDAQEYGTVFAIGYLGHFKNGRKDGYGIQFFCPDTISFPNAILEIAQKEVEDSGLTENDEGYLPAISAKFAEIYSTINYPFYEGIFKNDEISGRGNYSSYLSDITEKMIEDDEYENAYSDTDLLCDGYQEGYITSTIPVISLSVGSFNKGMPQDVKRYYQGEELMYGG